MRAFYVVLIFLSFNFHCLPNRTNNSKSYSLDNVISRAKYQKEKISMNIKDIKEYYQKNKKQNTIPNKNDSNKIIIDSTTQVDIK